MKKFLAFVLILSMLPLSFSVHAEGEEAFQTASISAVILDESTASKVGNYFDIYTTFRVLLHENDILFSLDDLATLSNFFLDSESNPITLTRESKVVSFDTEKLAIRCQQQDWFYLEPNQAVYWKGQWYLSGEMLLPCLNVNCTADDGVLYIAPNAVSFWDFYMEADSLNAYAFSLEYCAEKMDINTKELELASYLRNGMSYITTDFFFGEGFFDEREYYAMFEEFIQDETAAGQAFNQSYEAVSVLFELIGCSSNYLKALAPGSEEVADILGPLEGPADSAMRIITLNSLFKQDNSLKLDMLQEICDTTAVSVSDPMENAAREIIASYEEYLLGVLYILRDELSREIVELCINTDSIYSTMEIFVNESLNLIPTANPKMERLPYYQTMMTVGQRIYADALQGESSQYLYLAEVGAALYLYASEQSYRAMTQCAIDNDVPPGCVTEFSRLANSADYLYGQLLAASTSILNDSANVYEHDQWRGTYSDVLAQLNTERVDGDAPFAVEQAIFMNYLSEYVTPQWTRLDMDGDQVEELVMVYADKDGLDTFTVMDTSSVDCYITYYASELISAKNGASAVLDTGAGHAELYCSWNGLFWQQETEYDCWGGMNGESLESFYIFGEETDRPTYEAAVDAMSLGQPVKYDNPSLTSVRGDAQALLNQLDSHFAARPGALKTLTADMGNDGDSDRIYLLYGAGDYWRQRMTGYFSADFSFLGVDRSVTAVLAVNQGNRVDFRLIQLSVPLDQIAQIAEASAFDDDTQTLCIGKQRWFYYANDNTISVWLNDGHPLSNVLLHKGGYEMEALMDVYTQRGEDLTFFSEYDGMELMVYWRDVSMEDMPDVDPYLLSTVSCYPDLQELAPGLTNNSSEWEFSEYMMPTDDWTVVMEFFTTPTGEYIGKRTRHYTQVSTGLEYACTNFFFQSENDSNTICFLFSPAW